MTDIIILVIFVTAIAIILICHTAASREEILLELRKQRGDEKEGKG